MKKYNLSEIENQTIYPKKISEEYRDGNIYNLPLIGGYRILKECLGDHVINWHNIRREKFYNMYGWYQEDIEDQMYLNILEELNNKKNKIKIVEIGIGYAQPSLTFAGLIDNTNLFKNIKEYEILGLDAHKKHCEWSSKELKEQILGKSEVVHSAISNFDGEVLFPQTDAENEYGFSLGQGETVTCCRFESLLKKHNIDVVDILHIDVQGQELEVINDSKHFLNKINFMYIGTHSPEIHQSIISTLNDLGIFDIILDIPHLSKKDIPNFGTYITTDWFDGIIFCKLKEIVI